jgi:glycosyltransferase involved in cell wall biosynthesis
MNILYLTYNSVMTLGILRSQVETLLKLLSAKYPDELKFTLITVERWKDYRNKELKTAFRQEIKKAGIRVIIVPKLLPEFLRIETAKRTFFQRFWSTLAFLVDLKLLFYVSGYTCIRYRIQIIHARSYVPGFIGLSYKWILRKKVIFDPRGLIPEELLLAQGWLETSWKYRVWKRIEKWLLKGADKVYVLSEPFAKHYQKIVPELKPLITPCCVDTTQFIYDAKKRAELRKKFGIEDKLVVVFTVGCFVPYQLLDGGIKLFQQIQKLEPKSILLLLTPDKDQIQQYLTRNPRISHLASRISIFSPNFTEMPDYLLMSDIGLLVRVPSVISEVASPVKFAEYLACGVPVIAYPNIGDTQKIIDQEQVGVVINPSNEVYTEQQIQKLLSELSDRETLALHCRTTAINQLSWEKYLDLYYTTYQSLLKPQINTD